MLITIVKDPANISEHELCNVPDGTYLSDWLIEKYGADGFQVPTRIFEGRISNETELDLSDFESVDRPFFKNVFIVHHPLGFETAFAFLQVKAAAQAFASLIPIPELPTGERRDQKSPNNSLSNQTNIARPLERVPEIFGQVKSFPDLIAPTTNEYINNVLYATEYMCIGRGYYDISEIKSGDTLISAIPGSSAQVYEPGSGPTEVLRTTVSNEVKSLTLNAPNDTGVKMGSTFTLSYASGPDEGTITGFDGVWDEFLIGSTVTLVDVYFNNGSTELDLDGVYTVSNVTDTAITFSAAATINSNWTDAALPEPMLDLLAITESRILNPLALLPDQNIVRGPFVVPGNVNDEIWVDFSAPRGLVRDTNQPYTIDVRVTVEEIDIDDNPTGPSFTVDYSFTDNELDPRFYTRKITSADGMEEGKRYRVSAERTSNTDLNDSTLIDQFKWTRLAGIDDITATDETGTTRIQITTQATEQTASLQDRRFNMIAQRKVVTWDGVNVIGDIETGVNLAASSRMADIFLHYALDPALGARDESGIDIAAIYAIQVNLDAVFDGELGEFNYTFDNQNTPALEEMRQIANAARCFVFREGSVISMVRDEKQTISRALFNRRNKLPESESKTIRFNKPLDNDGVQLEYRDKSDNKTKTIILPDELPIDDPNYNLPNALNPIKIESTGVANPQQAWNRAQYELNRIIHNRVSVETKVTEEGILLPLNARIEHVDGTTLSRVQSNGEVTAVDDVTITTSERCIFDVEKTYSVILRNDLGEPSEPIGVFPRTDTEFGFILEATPSFAIYTRGENDYQVGTLYNFAPDGDELSNQYLVQRKTPDSDGNVTLELINYTDKYYQADEQDVPVTRAYSDGYDEGFE